MSQGIDVPPVQLKGGRSVELPGLTHGSNPIPTGARVGGLVCSSGIAGKDRASGALPSSEREQVVHAFKNMRDFLVQAGAGLEHVVRVTVHLSRDDLREAVNQAWLTCFPDPQDRPARHTIIHDLPYGMAVQLELIAMVDA